MEGEPRLVGAGWDGRSEPREEWLYPCGCRETNQTPRVIVKMCLSHLVEGMSHVRLRLPKGGNK